MGEWLPQFERLDRGQPKHKGLAGAIMTAIENGELAPGARMPTHRALATRLGVSVQTVGTAYKELERRGYLRGEVGRGTFVTGRVTDSAARFMLDKRQTGMIDLSTIRGVYTEHHGRTVGTLLAALSHEEPSNWFRPCRPIAGLDEPRTIGANWLKRFGLDVEPERLIITSGASQGIFLALATVVQNGDVVLTEGLTDHGVIGCAHILGFALRGLPTDRHGILPDAFERACREHSVRALVCTPTFSNPTMHLADAERRTAIADIARRYGVFVIEDDVFGALLDEPLPSVAGMIPDLGFYCTSFTKAIASGLRTGYLVVPSRLTIRTGSVLRVTGWMSPALLAEMAARWIVEGTLEELIAIQRKALALRQEAVSDLLGNHVLSSHPRAPAAWVRVPDHWDEESLVLELRDRGVAVTAADPFMVPPTVRPKAVRVCIGGAIDDDELRRALSIMSATFSKFPAINATEFS